MDLINKFTHRGETYCEGDGVSCKIEGTQITDGEIFYQWGYIFILNNVISRWMADWYSWYNYHYLIWTIDSQYAIWDQVRMIKKSTTSEKIKEKWIERKFWGFSCSYIYDKENVTIIESDNNWEYKTTYYGDLELFLRNVEKLVEGAFLAETDKKVNGLMEVFERQASTLIKELSLLIAPITKPLIMASAVKSVTSVLDKLEEEFKGGTFSGLINKLKK